MQRISGGQTQGVVKTNILIGPALRDLLGTYKDEMHALQKSHAQLQHDLSKLSSQESEPIETIDITPNCHRLTECLIARVIAWAALKEAALERNPFIFNDAPTCASAARFWQAFSTHCLGEAANTPFRYYTVWVNQLAGLAQQNNPTNENWTYRSNQVTNGPDPLSILGDPLTVEILATRQKYLTAHNNNLVHHATLLDPFFAIRQQLERLAARRSSLSGQYLETVDLGTLEF